MVCEKHLWRAQDNIFMSTPLHIRQVYNVTAVKFAKYLTKSKVLILFDDKLCTCAGSDVTKRQHLLTETSYTAVWVWSTCLQSGC